MGHMGSFTLRFSQPEHSAVGPCVSGSVELAGVPTGMGDGQEVDKPRPECPRGVCHPLPFLWEAFPRGQ